MSHSLSTMYVESSPDVMYRASSIQGEIVFKFSESMGFIMGMTLSYHDFCIRRTIESRRGTFPVLVRIVDGRLTVTVK